MDVSIRSLFVGVPAPLGIFAGVTVMAYFLGCFNGAVVVSRFILRNDVRNHGSGNAGLTNFYRTFGGGMTLIVLAADVMKTVVAVELSVAIYSCFLPGVPVFIRYWTGLFCMLGHMFPCMFQFHGGKGVLSSGALVFLLDWRIAAMLWGVFLLVVLVTRYVSLGACCGVALFPLMSALVYRSVDVTVMAALIAALVIWQHRSNIRRLMRGEESKFHFQKKKVEP